MGAERLDVVEAGIANVHGADGDHRRQCRMPEDAAGGSAVLHRGRAQAEQLEAARRARNALDEDVGELVGVGLVHDRDQLDRVLCAGLRVDALRDDVQVGVEKDEVVVVGGAAERIVPLQDAGERTACRHDDPVEGVACARREVVELPVRPRGRKEVLLEVFLGFVAGGGVIRDARRHRGVDGCGHGAILEVRLAEEPQVVDDHVRAGVG